MDIKTKTVIASLIVTFSKRFAVWIKKLIYLRALVSKQKRHKRFSQDQICQLLFELETPTSKIQWKALNLDRISKICVDGNISIDHAL